MSAEQAITPETIKKGDRLLHLQQRGIQAQAILDNPVWDECWRSMKAQLVEALGEVNLQDSEGVLLIVQRLKVVEQMKRNFESFIAVGEQAEKDLERDRAELQRRQAEFDRREQHVLVRGIRRAQQHLRGAPQVAPASDET
jgi:hypothetical protein